jgi:hypothetical protein
MCAEIECRHSLGGPGHPTDLSLTREPRVSPLAFASPHAKPHGTRRSRAGTRRLRTTTRTRHTVTQHGSPARPTRMAHTRRRRSATPHILVHPLASVLRRPHSAQACSFHAAHPSRPDCLRSGPMGPAHHPHCPLRHTDSSWHGTACSVSAKGCRWPRTVHTRHQQRAASVDESRPRLARIVLPALSRPLRGAYHLLAREERIH